ncbi:SusC/RagA family TonB-linked outer membrane protein [Arenibacter aquaticus]|uniref:SusC/RagA family TonB-linked outer membrane protein n=1 Tax=Arenibacter aquaticus TaxID=2489054 RepID=A0A3S0INF9_9FLAO|nr:SusC/RagA family TonB-linked outer membrane protein [Arenibacter aquaticus]RTE53978.1 SusC/RagA family TonB-linked outer membrane protein [Arenibacter aquaticus]
MKIKMLMRKSTFLALIFQLLIVGYVQSQNANQDKLSISGNVVDENNLPLPYVNVYVKGTPTGTMTNDDGEFSIMVAKGKTISFSYVGYVVQDVVVNDASQLTVALEPDSDELAEVIVTALGIKKEKKAIGYSVDAISSEEINSTGEPNVLLNLSAKAPGVQVTGSANGVDGSPRVLIRGVTSLSSDNQPLYVLDGLPLLSNRSLSESLFTSSSGASDLGNPLSDINPNDIENISILKGASATALYGARGANGVIMITTKKGKSGQKGWGANISSSTTFQSALILPEPQLNYGQGFDGEFSYVDGNGAGVNESNTNLWGPAYNGQEISQWDPNTGGAVVKPWLPYGANNLKNFFETGHTIQQNLSLTHVTETSNARLSLGHQDIKGITPNTGLERITGSFNSSFQIGEKLNLNFVATGSTMNSDNRTSYGGGGALWQTLFIPTNIDIRDLRNYKDEFGNKVSFYENGPNPYWDLYENVNPVTRTRFSFNVGLDYAVNDWISLQGNVFQDTNTTEYERIVAKHLYNNGGYQEGLDLNKEVNADFRLNINRDLFRDLNLNLMVGAATRHEESNRKYAATDGGLLVRGIYNLGNSAKPAIVNNSKTEKEVNSVFSSLELNYKSYAFLTVTGRNDWSSTLPKDDWSFFYPSVSSSFIFTDALNIKSNFLNYGKLRGSWAKVGNDTQPYALDRFITRSTSSFNGQPVMGIDNVIPATTLIPEESTSFEVGGELYLIDSRVKLDVAYYKNESSNQLIRVENAWERGARFAFINAGTITNKGIEVKLELTPITTKDFRWDVNMNWSQNRGAVSGFPEDLVDFKHIAAWYGPEIRATNGKPYGHIVGFEYFRDTQDALANVPNMASDFENFGYTAENNIYGTGKILTRNGFPMHNQWRGTRDLEESAPLDWSGGIRNSFNYKNFNLNFLFDFRYGGKVISTTYQFMSLNGLNPDSAGINANGVAVRDNVTDGGGFIFDGIDVETGQPNTTAISTQDLYSNFNYPTSDLMRDATNIKLRELSIGYRLDNKVTHKLGLSDVNISLIGRNLWLIKNNLDGIDTETANMGSLNNGSGFEYGSLPNTRSIGMNLSVSF